MKNVAIFLFSLAGILFGQDKGWLTADVQHDTVMISHIQTVRNCAALYIIEAVITDYEILIIERDTSNAAVHCICNFDLSVMLAPLPAGNYHAEVIGLDYTSPETLYFGGVDFTVGQKINLLKMDNSGCLNPEKKNNNVDNNDISLTVSSDSLILLWHTPEVNCGFQPLWSGWLTADTFFVTVVDTGPPLDCLCSFDQTAVFGPFAPGNYVLAFQLEDYGYYDFTIFGLDKPASASVISFHQSECYQVQATYPESQMASDFLLAQNYPNPFNAETTIKFTLPQRQRVTIAVIDINGNLVETVLDETLDQGFHSTRWNASHLSSGIYLIKIGLADRNRVLKAVLLK